MAENTKNTQTKKPAPKSKGTGTVPKVSKAKAEESISTKYQVRTTVDPNAVIPVTNGFQGMLVVKNRRSGEIIAIFEEFGDVQDITYGDLKSIKASDKAFFENNWLLFDDPEIIEALVVTNYYEKSLSLHGFDDLFSKSPEEIKGIISKLSKAQKRSVAYKARNLIIDNKLDSLKVIDALEESLAIKLLER